MSKFLNVFKSLFSSIKTYTTSGIYTKSVPVVENDGSAIGNISMSNLQALFKQEMNPTLLNGKNVQNDVETDTGIIARPGLYHIGLTGSGGSGLVLLGDGVDDNVVVSKTGGMSGEAAIGSKSNMLFKKEGSDNLFIKH